MLLVASCWLLVASYYLFNSYLLMNIDEHFVTSNS